MQKISDGRPSDAGKPFAFVRREARTCSKVGGPCGRRPDTEQSSASGPCVALDLIALKHPSISVLNCETVQSDNHNLDCVCLRVDARKRGRFCVGHVTQGLAGQCCISRCLRPQARGLRYTELVSVIRGLWAQPYGGCRAVGSALRGASA